MSDDKEKDGRRFTFAALQELFDVRGTVALVTGGGSGLGEAMATVLVECGARVVVADRDQDRLDRVVRVLADAGHAEAARLDVADRTAVDTLVDDVVARHGRIDAVFANAGIALGAGPGQPDGQLDTFDLAEWTTLFDVNLYGVLNTMRAAARHMKRQRAGSIVVTASTAGLRADPFVSYSYVVAKAGVVNLTRQAALDLARCGSGSTPSPPVRSGPPSAGSGQRIRNGRQCGALSFRSVGWVIRGRSAASPCCWRRPRPAS